MNKIICLDGLLSLACFGSVGGLTARWQLVENGESPSEARVDGRHVR